MGTQKQKQNAFDMMMRAAKNKDIDNNKKTKRSESGLSQPSPKKHRSNDSSTAGAMQRAQICREGRQTGTLQEIVSIQAPEAVSESAYFREAAAGSQLTSLEVAPVAVLSLPERLSSGQSSSLDCNTQHQPASSAAPGTEAAEPCCEPQPQLQQPAAGPDQQHAAAVAAFKSVFQGQSASARQNFDYLAVYDLEATCNQARSLQPIEIIELSCVLVETKSAKIASRFQAYVQPSEHPQLDPFCVELTGIQQQQIDSAQPLQQVLDEHHKWLEQQGMFGQGIKFLAVTWTDWDFAVCLCAECAWRRIQRPDYLCSWVDLKRQFYAKYKLRGNLRKCVEAAGLRWQGRAHNGLDDATNTARLAIKIMAQGVILDVTQTSENPPVVQQQQQQQIDTPGSGNGTPTRKGSGRGSTGGKASALSGQSSRGAMMCKCGVKAQLRTTKRPGPNHGRQFYSCGTWTITAQQSRGCGFFVWTDDLADA